MAVIHRTSRPEADFRIEPQTQAVLDGRAVRVIRFTDADNILVRIEGTNAQQWTTAAALGSFREPVSGEGGVRHSAIANPEAEARAQAWHRHFSALSAQGRLSRAQKASIAKAMGTSLRTVGRHYARYLASPTV